jgi:hypothetical protein
VAHVPSQLKEIMDDQPRLPANLGELPEKAPASKRYLEKCDTQETEIERFRARIKQLQEPGSSGGRMRTTWPT